MKSTSHIFINKLKLTLGQLKNPRVLVASFACSHVPRNLSNWIIKRACILN